MSQSLPNGLEVLREHLDLKTIMRLIERTARWADIETFRFLPIWAPEYARRVQLYNANWTVPRANTNRRSGARTLKLEGNTEANKALTEALDLRAREHWSCCHIWGVDDQSYQKHNAIVQNHRYFSCIANMVFLPSPLKAFTDAMPEVKAMLRLCARNYYGWVCDHESAEAARAQIDAWEDWDVYPASWPHSAGVSAPLGVVAFNDRIRRNAERRLARIRKDIESAGPHYPRDEVRSALAYWGVTL